MGSHVPRCKEQPYPYHSHRWDAVHLHILLATNLDGQLVPKFSVTANTGCTRWTCQTNTGIFVGCCFILFLLFHCSLILLIIINQWSFLGQIWSPTCLGMNDIHPWSCAIPKPRPSTQCLITLQHWPSALNFIKKQEVWYHVAQLRLEVCLHI